MADARVVWLICAGGFVFLAIAGIALGIMLAIHAAEIKKLRRDIAKCVIRITDLERADKK